MAECHKKRLNQGSICCGVVCVVLGRGVKLCSISTELGQLTSGIAHPSSTKCVSSSSCHLMIC